MDRVIESGLFNKQRYSTIPDAINKKVLMIREQQIEQRGDYRLQRRADKKARLTTSDTSNPSAPLRQGKHFSEAQVKILRSLDRNLSNDQIVTNFNVANRALGNNDDRKWPSLQKHFTKLLPTATFTHSDMSTSMAASEVSTSNVVPPPATAFSVLINSVSSSLPSTSMAFQPHEVQLFRSIVLKNQKGCRWKIVAATYNAQVTELNSASSGKRYFTRSEESLQTKHKQLNDRDQ